MHVSEYDYTPGTDRRLDPARQDPPPGAAPMPVAPAVLNAEGGLAPDEMAAVPSVPVARLLGLLRDGEHPRDAGLAVLPDEQAEHDSTLCLLLKATQLYPSTETADANADFGDAVAWACLAATDLRLRAATSTPTASARVSGSTWKDADGRSARRTVTIRVVAIIEGGAQPVVDLLWERWQPDAKQSFVITGIGATGTELKLQATYTARGANSNDGKKKVLAAAEKLGLTCSSIDAQLVGAGSVDT